MREIKFRAWDKKTKRMFIIFDSEEQEEWYLPTCRDNYVVMQYTGLKDKNGTEIYEGDICKVSNDTHYSNNYFNTEDKWKMTMISTLKDYCYMFYDIEDKFMTIYFIEALEDGMSIEIIGNIFENPELLEGN